MPGEPKWIKNYRGHKTNEPCTVRHPSTLRTLKHKGVITCDDAYLNPSFLNKEVKSSSKKETSPQNQGSTSPEQNPLTPEEEALRDVNPESYNEIKAALANIEGVSSSGNHDALKTRRVEYLQSRGVAVE